MTLAWYAAYGSNTDEARFRRYLVGCREPVEPLDNRPLVIDLPLYFAGTRTRWGAGGVAFAGPDREPVPTTLARAWLLPVERIADVGAQENGLSPGEGHLDPAAGDHTGFPGRWYDAWRDCGCLDGIPVLTLTASEARSPLAPPARAYAQIIARGLRHTHEMAPDDVARYLAPRANLPIGTLIRWQEAGPG